MLGKEQCLKYECKHNHTFKHGQIYASSRQNTTHGASWCTWLARVVAAHHSFTKAHECCTACPLRHRSCLVLLFDAYCGYRIVDANMSVPACGRQCWRCCSLYSTSPVQPHWFVLPHNQPGCMAVRCAVYVASSCTALTAADGASRLPRLGITSV